MALRDRRSFEDKDPSFLLSPLFLKEHPFCNNIIVLIDINNWFFDKYLQWQIYIFKPEVHPQQPSDSGNKAATSTNFAQAPISPHQPSRNFIANSDVSKVSMESHPVIEQLFPPFSTFYQTAPTSLPIITSAPVSTTSNLSGANCADFWLDQNFEASIKIEVLWINLNRSY